MKATMLLEKQHRKVETLFKALETNRYKAQDVVEELATDLAAHSAIEEEIFYPAAKRFKKDLVLKSYEDHQILAFALKRLVGADVNEDSFVARLAEVKELVLHHVAEEERELFPAAAQELGDEQNEALGKQMEARFKELEGAGYEGAVVARKSKRAHDGGHAGSTKKKAAHKATHASRRAA